MAFRRRNVGVLDAKRESLGEGKDEKLTKGVRPSPLDGRLATSTGTQSLDNLLGGHAGLVLGSSLLIEESGTTDFSGVLLRYFAAEGLVQGHQLHVLGMDSIWARELPGLSDNGTSPGNDERRLSAEKMKIAWRYERLGDFGIAARGGHSLCT